MIEEEYLCFDLSFDDEHRADCLDSELGSGFHSLSFALDLWERILDRDFDWDYGRSPERDSSHRVSQIVSKRLEFEGLCFAECCYLYALRQSRRRKREKSASFHPVFARWFGSGLSVTEGSERFA